MFSQSFPSEPEKQQQQHGEEEEEDGEGADDDSKQSLQTCWAGACRAGSNLIIIYKLLSFVELEFDLSLFTKVLI